MADSQKAGADLDKITDYVEETELDSAKLAKAMDGLADAEDEAAKEAAAQREKELAAVEVKKEDVSLIAEELEMDSAAAERILRENNGDLASALRTIVA